MARTPAETRINQIYRAAARLFVDKGYAATSMNEIAEAVGITKAGLYYFVKSKDDLALNLITWAYDVYDRDVFIPAQGISDPLERLRFIVRAHLYNVGDHRGAADNSVTVLLDDPAALTPVHRRSITRRKAVYYGFLRDTLAALRDRGQLIDVDPTVAAFSLLGMILWLARWRRSGGRLSLDEIVSQMTEVALRGVLREEALQSRAIVPPEASAQRVRPAERAPARRAARNAPRPDRSAPATDVAVAPGTRTSTSALTGGDLRLRKVQEEADEDVRAPEERLRQP
jgi:AcrR family transcriptional regulator